MYTLRTIHPGQREGHARDPHHGQAASSHHPLHCWDKCPGCSLGDGVGQLSSAWSLLLSWHMDGLGWKVGRGWWWWWPLTATNRSHMLGCALARPRSRLGLILTAWQERRYSKHFLGVTLITHWNSSSEPVTEKLLIFQNSVHLHTS